MALFARRRIKKNQRTPVPPGDTGPRPAPRASPCLAWQAASGGEQRFPLVNGENTIGRDLAGNRIVIAAPTVSRKHAVITAQDGDCIFRSLSERSTSLINGNPVTGSCRLKQGDRIELGDETLIFIMQEEFYER